MIVLISKRSTFKDFFFLLSEILYEIMSSMFFFAWPSFQYWKLLKSISGRLISWAERDPTAGTHPFCTEKLLYSPSFQAKRDPQSM